VDLLAKPSLGADAEAISNQQHPDHQLGIDRRPPKVAVEACQLAPEITQFDEPVYRPKQMVGWNMLTTQPVRLADVPSSSSALPISQTESSTSLRRNSRLFNAIGQKATLGFAKSKAASSYFLPSGATASFHFCCPCVRSHRPK
jgi:hypothetical protein